MGRGIKWASIRKLETKEKVDVLCLQETKKEVIENNVCLALWGNYGVSWKMQPACNSAGGLLCIWNEEAFKVEKKMRGNGFIYLKGAWAADGAKVIIVNIYSPCDIVLKRNLWKQIRQLRTANIGELWSILGDFNNVRRPLERVGISQRMQDEGIIKEFNEWIADLRG